MGVFKQAKEAKRLRSEWVALYDSDDAYDPPMTKQRRLSLTQNLRSGIWLTWPTRWVSRREMPV